MLYGQNLRTSPPQNVELVVFLGQENRAIHLYTRIVLCQMQFQASAQEDKGMCVTQGRCIRVMQQELDARRNALEDMNTD